MADYKNIDALILTWNNTGDGKYDEGFEDGIDFVLDEIDEIPIEKDIVKVVRCKDCKLRNSDNCAMYYYSNESGEQYSWNYDNDFCSWGKAMELEKTD